ncbi:MAG TPA: RtcB family protein [Hyphomicrobiaceae bacterium]|nr:RtcB family protein [Hyphomicrobiaceae bacterium]
MAEIETTNLPYITHLVPGGTPIKMWTKGVQIGDEAIKQMENVARLPIIHGHVSAMPDCHWGMGATVGSVIPTRSAIIPAAVGVDIGCGMMAWKLTLKAKDLPDTLTKLRSEIERAVPHGFNSTKGRARKGGWEIVPDSVGTRWRELEERYRRIIERHPRISHKSPAHQLGSLGTGNHFIEVCLDENDDVWVMLHSGSRGPGNIIGRYFIELAKQDMRSHIANLPDENLAYLSDGTQHFDDYVEALNWAQDYAWDNRQAMMESVLRVLRKHLPKFKIGNMAVNCHHNYATIEHHFGADVWVTRKGAVRAREGDLGIIPGSMGTGSFIVRGKGNPESLCSCSHGAGRAMSRNEAKQKITLADHRAATEGIECRKDKDVLDESPAAYKDIASVIAAQADLIEVVHRLRQVLNVKG